MQLLLKSSGRQNKSGAYIPKFLLKGLGKAVFMDWSDCLQRPRICFFIVVFKQKYYKSESTNKNSGILLQTWIHQNRILNQSAPEEFNTLQRKYDFFNFNCFQIQIAPDAASGRECAIVALCNIFQERNFIGCTGSGGWIMNSWGEPVLHDIAICARQWGN